MITYYDFIMYYATLSAEIVPVHSDGDDEDSTPLTADSGTLLDEQIAAVRALLPYCPTSRTTGSSQGGSDPPSRLQIYYSGARDPVVLGTLRGFPPEPEGAEVAKTYAHIHVYMYIYIYIYTHTKTRASRRGPAAALAI